jgi:hypothetical protein
MWQPTRDDAWLHFRPSWNGKNIAPGLSASARSGYDPQGKLSPFKIWQEAIRRWPAFCFMLSPHFIITRQVQAEALGESRYDRSSHH